MINVFQTILNEESTLVFLDNNTSGTKRKALSINRAVNVYKKV